jgi:NTE family protein
VPAPGANSADRWPGERTLEAHLTGGCSMPAIPKVAIACQGGGSHAAFAAGVLLQLLEWPQRERVQVVGLSGTSGGAMCAALAWRGLVAGDPDDARRRLDRFWRDLEVHDLFDAIVNLWTTWLADLPLQYEVSPYLYEPAAEPRLRALLHQHLDLEHLDADAGQRTRPKLFVGATDVLNGDRVAFEGESLTYDDLIASAAVPPLFRAVNADGHLYWDGLFTSNPPVREFTELHERPDEIWVVQINPQRRRKEPRSMPEIVDRRNELAGNLSLGQELAFVDKINQLLAHHPSLGAHYQHIQVRVVELEGDQLDYASKLDRRSALIEHLLAEGRARAEWFFDRRSEWPRARTAPARSVRVARTSSPAQPPAGIAQATDTPASQR